MKKEVLVHWKLEFKNKGLYKKSKYRDFLKYLESLIRKNIPSEAEIEEACLLGYPFKISKDGKVTIIKDFYKNHKTKYQHPR